MKNYFLLIASILSLSFNMNAQDIYTLEETYEIKEAGLLTLKTSDANITVQAGDRKDVFLEVYREVDQIGAGGEEKFEIMVENRNDNLFIREVRSGDMSYFIGYKSIDYKIRLEIPMNTKLVINEEDGDLTIHDLNGTADLRVEDGDINIVRFKGTSLNINTEDGDILIINAGGNLTIESEDGDIDTKSCHFSSVNAKSEDGDLRIQTSVQKEGKYSFSAEDGDVRLEISGDGAELALETEDGSIDILGDFQEISYEEENRSLKFGDGSAFIEISTKDGNIRVSR